jgi:hypothetical protein
MAVDGQIMETQREANEPVLFDQERGQVDQDAKRYQWLREQRGWPESEAAMIGISPEGFDETIDALMAEGK